MGRVGLVLLAGALALAAAPAQGQSDDDARARARPLALEAVQRLDKKDFGGALEHAQRAEAVYHAPTHLSFVARSLEGLGRLAEALAVYERLLAEPSPRGAPAPYEKAREAAKERVRDLIARVPSLQIVVRGADRAAANVTVDGKALATGQREAVRADPGPHRIVVSAPGKKPVERTVELPERGGVVPIEITLEASDVAPPAAPPVAREPESRGGGGRIPAYVAFGVGGAGLAVGGVFGALGLSKMSGLRDRCPDDRCTPAEQSDIDTTKTFGTISTVGFVAGGVGVAAGVVLLIVAPGSRRGAETAAVVVPAQRGLAVRF